jgi:DNA-binding NarL/FixJ family response regulator
MRMQAVLLTRDLTVVSRVQGACAKLGATMRTESDLERIIAGFSGEPADLVILDLSMPQLDVASLVSAAKAGSAASKVIAFGPHVHAERLAAAREAGCDEVVSRGQFFAQLDTILQRSAGE